MQAPDNPATRGLAPGFKVGHWTDDEALTGCTVVLPPAGNVASCDIRGSSPSSRELALLHPDRKLTEIHALLLTGGSAFGLAAAQGVVEWLAEKGVGYQTGVAAVPIVPAAVIFDLGTGDPSARPGPPEGRAACDSAVEDPVTTGAVGVGSGATVGKWAGREFGVRGGLGIGSAEEAGHRVAALAVANAVGDIIGADGEVIAGSRSPDPSYRPLLPADPGFPAATVLAVVTTTANLDKRAVRWLAARGSDGITVSVRPAHTRYDGDVVFAIAASEGSEPTSPQSLDLLGYLATQAVAAAVRDAVRSRDD